MHNDSINVAPTPAAPIEAAVRGDFVSWLAATGGSLATTTYNSGKLAILSVIDGHLAISTWKFARPMGLAFSDLQLALAVRERILVFRIESDVARPHFRPSQIHRTGRIDVHDLAFDRRGLVFAATRFNCLARPSGSVNFKRAWLPPFMPSMVARDCCHLNGIGMRDCRPRLVTAFCTGSTPGAWRAGDRFGSGVAVAAPSGALVARGLNMPHSPRWHAGRWWVCNSGEGSVVAIDESTKTWDEVAAVPGFTRGLCFVDGVAVVGRSRIRKRHILDAPPVRRRFGRLRSGLSAIEPATGIEIGAVDFVRGGREVYDVAFLPGVARVEFAPPSLNSDANG